MKKKTNFNQGVIDKHNLKNPYKYVGKNDKIVFRSSYEYSFIQFLERNDKILEWSSEETVIRYKFQGRYHRYFVDFYIKYKNYNGVIKESLIEIKPYFQTQKPVFNKDVPYNKKQNAIKTYAKNQSKWKAAKNYCLKEKNMNGRDINFYTLTEKEIQMMPEEMLKENMKKDGFII